MAAAMTRTAVVAVLVGGFAVAAWADGDLVGHRAIYRMSLGSTSSASGVLAASGTMSYRFSDACDGWITENRSQVLFSYADGGETDSLWSFTTWEAKNGLDYRFAVKQVRNGQVVEDIGGKAKLGATGAMGEALFVRPENRPLPLPNGTVFPTAHLALLLAEAKAGKTLVLRPVFDGASLDNPYEVNALISPPVAMGKLTSAKVPGLEPRPAWDLRMAYFPMASSESRPEFELQVRYRDDGIALEVIQDFGDFSLKSTLEKIELLPKGGC